MLVYAPTLESVGEDDVMISDTDFAHAPPGGRWQAKSLGNAIVLLLAFSIVMYSLLTLLFLARGSDIDELGLFNPVYMKLYYGRMTYPIYGHFNAMFVHPPVRYSEIALLMRLGFSLPYAEGLMVCIIASLIAFVIAFGRFNLPCKLGLFFGVFTALVWMASIHQRTYGLRPETQIGLAWFLGLILLEDGKARDWELKRLFIGTFAITYASGLHYYAAPAFLGAAVYLMAARKHLSSSRFRSVAASIIAGGCLFGLPYLLFFVIPEFRQIIQFTGQVQQAGNWYSPILKHFEQYTWWRLNSGPDAIGPRLYYMIYPVLYTKVPAFCLGAVLL